MKAAPYTRETLQRIRNGASAADLGWDQKFYLDVCKRHEIAPVTVSAPVVTAQAIPAAPYTPPVRRLVDVERPKRPKLPRATHTGTYPVNLNGRVTEEMAVGVHNYAARNSLSMLEAHRRLIQIALDAVKAERTP